MTLYFIRHGIAEEPASPAGDAERRLTERGTFRTAMVAKGIKKLGLSFGHIISSPYVRARETAEIIARIVEHDSEIDFDRRLLPSGSYEDVSDLINEYTDAESLMLCGHEPSMSGFISGLCADGALRIDVKKASVTAIDVYRLKPRAQGSLLWSIPPGLIEAMMFA